MRAIKIRQRGTDIYITAMTAHDLIDRSDVYTWSETRRDGYQRELKAGDISKLRGYLEKEGILPTSVLVSVEEIRLRGETRIDDTMSIVEIEPRGMWIVDGQRRKMSLEKLLADRNFSSTFQNFPLPVCLFQSQDRLHEMEQFYIVNRRQKSVPTDLAQQLLYEEYSARPVAFFEFLKRSNASQGEILSGLAVSIVRELRDHSPWRKLIRPPNELRGGRYLIPQRAMADSIGRFILRNDQEFMNTYDQLNQDPDNTAYRQRLENRLKELANYLKDYWRALKAIYRVAFTNPSEYSIQRSTGVYSFHRIFSGNYPMNVWRIHMQQQGPLGVYHHCKRRNNFSENMMRSIFNHMINEASSASEFGRSVDDEFWHKGRRGIPPLGHAMARATNQRDIGELSVRLGKHLPPLP